MLSTDRTDRILYTLISNKYATLAEIRDKYDIYEVLDLYEIYIISAYNKYIITKNIQK